MSLKIYYVKNLDFKDRKLAKMKETCHFFLLSISGSFSSKLIYIRQFMYLFSLSKIFEIFSNKNDNLQTEKSYFLKDDSIDSADGQNAI